MCNALRRQPCGVQVGGRVGYAEEGLLLDIVQSRPNIPAVLAAAAAESAQIAPGADIGVYVAGPRSPRHTYPTQ